MRSMQGWLALMLAAIPSVQSSAQRPDSARLGHRERPLYGQVRDASPVPGG